MTPPRWRVSLWRGGCAGAAALAALALYTRLGALSGRDFARFSGSAVPAAAAPALELRDDRNRPFDLASLRGQAVLVYFGYVRCPDVCPTVLNALAPVFDRLGHDAARVRVVFVTLDPTHDTPAALHDFLANFRPTPIGLTGRPRDVESIARAWQIGWQDAGPDGRINHLSVLTLVGPDGHMRARYGMTQLGDPSGMASDIRSVL